MNNNRPRPRHQSTKTILLLFLLLTAAPVARASDEGEGKAAARSIGGMVYYTNNTPEDNAFLVELFDSKRRRVSVKWTEGQTGRFEFKGLKAGRYYLQVSASPRCLLQYEVDAREKQPERLRVFGDADCGRAKVEGLPKPRPVPRDRQR
jgi:hypothetical protein